MVEINANVAFKNMNFCAISFNIFTLGAFKRMILKSMQEQNEGNIVIFPSARTDQRWKETTSE